MKIRSSTPERTNRQTAAPAASQVDIAAVPIFEAAAPALSKDRSTPGHHQAKIATPPR